MGGRAGAERVGGSAAEPALEALALERSLLGGPFGARPVDRDDRVGGRVPVAVHAGTRLRAELDRAVAAWRASSRRWRLPSATVPVPASSHSLRSPIANAGLRSTSTTPVVGAQQTPQLDARRDAAEAAAQDQRPPAHLPVGPIGGGWRCCQLSVMTTLPLAWPCSR